MAFYVAKITAQIPRKISGRILRFTLLYTFSNFCHTRISVFARVGAGSGKVCRRRFMPLVCIRRESDDSRYNPNNERLKKTAS